MKTPGFISKLLGKKERPNYGSFKVDRKDGRDKTSPSGKPAYARAAVPDRRGRINYGTFKTSKKVVESLIGK